MLELSVVILNYTRPRTVRRIILPALLNYDAVTEIIVSHGRKSAQFELEHPKLVHLDHTGAVNSEYGLSRRFLAAANARNEHVMILDDDLLPYQSTVAALAAAVEAGPSSVHGLYGRILQPGPNGLMYNAETTCFGEVHILLTRCLVATRALCQHYIQEFRKHESKLVKQSRPYWNGEDILFSLLSIAKTNQLPVAHDLPHVNIDTNIGGGISAGAAHREYRTSLIREVVPRLALKPLLASSKARCQPSIGYDIVHSCWFPLGLVGIGLLIAAVVAAVMIARRRRSSAPAPGTRLRSLRSSRLRSRPTPRRLFQKVTSYSPN